jgi:hypothetical protein
MIFPLVKKDNLVSSTLWFIGISYFKKQNTFNFIYFKKESMVKKFLFNRIVIVLGCILIRALIKKLHLEKST